MRSPSQTRRGRDDFSILIPRRAAFAASGSFFLVSSFSR